LTEEVKQLVCGFPGRAAKAQVVKLEKLLPIIRGEEEGLGPLAQQGVIPKFQYSEKQRSRIDTEQNLASQRRTVVNAGTVLMSLVPVDEELVAEVCLRNKDVGFVQEGQSVKIKLATFPFQKYGMVEGTVMRISADAADPQKQNDGSQAPEQSTLSAGKAIVALKQQSLTRGDFSRPLAPGMQIVAEIRQGERTVLGYLLSPVQKSFKEAACVC